MPFACRKKRLSLGCPSVETAKTEVPCHGWYGMMKMPYVPCIGLNFAAFHHPYERNVLLRAGRNFEECNFDRRHTTPGMIFSDVIQIMKTWKSPMTNHNVSVLSKREITIQIYF